MLHLRRGHGNERELTCQRKTNTARRNATPEESKITQHWRTHAQQATLILTLVLAEDLLLGSSKSCHVQSVSRDLWTEDDEPRWLLRTSTNFLSRLHRVKVIKQRTVPRNGAQVVQLRQHTPFLRHLQPRPLLEAQAPLATLLVTGRGSACILQQRIVHLVPLQQPLLRPRSPVSMPGQSRAE